MKHLILTTDSSGAGCLAQAAIADIVIPFDIRFTSGPLPSDAELANSLATRSTKSRRAVPYWLNDTGWRNEKIRRKGFGLIDLCEQCEAVELWIDPDPNAQLVLIWLLDYFRSHGSTASKLSLVQADVGIGNKFHEDLAMWRPPAVEVSSDHLETAGLAWQAYRAPTPQAWSDLLDKDLSALPQLRQTVLELLEELPTRPLWRRPEISAGTTRSNAGGGTELTSDHLWRWDPANRALIAP
jgi:hypothetical protein